MRLPVPCVCSTNGGADPGINAARHRGVFCLPCGVQRFRYALRAGELARVLVWSMFDVAKRGAGDPPPHPTVCNAAVYRCGGRRPAGRRVLNAQRKTLDGVFGFRSQPPRVVSTGASASVQRALTDSEIAGHTLTQGCGCDGCGLAFGPSVEFLPEPVKAPAIEPFRVELARLYPDYKKVNQKPVWTGTPYVGGDVVPAVHDAYVATDGEVCARSGHEWLFQCPTTGRGYVVPVACLKLDCGTCRAKVRTRRGGRLAARIGAEGLGCAVFTFPVQLRSVLGWRAVPKIRRKLAKMIKGWALCWFQQKLGFYICFHPEGDSQPGVWKPHFHVGWSLLGSSLEKIPYMLPEHVLEDLKARWLDVLYHIADSTGIDRVGIAVNVRYEFKLERGHATARARYDARSFPSWSAAEFDGLEVQPGMPQGVARYVSYGLLSPGSKADEWRQRVSMPVFDEKMAPEEQRILCRCCAEPMPLIYLQTRVIRVEPDTVSLHPDTHEPRHRIALLV